MIRRLSAALLAASSILSVGVAHADGKELKTEIIRVGTLAPADSPWGAIYKVWQKAIRERTKLPDGQKTADGKDYSLDITMFWNGQQGDEGAMISKMKSGQLDSCGVTTTGLAQLYRPILALQIPGLLNKWELLDKARDELRPEFEKGVKAAGFTIGGWGDVGLVRTMSKGFPVLSAADMHGKRPWMWREDPISPIFYQVQGGVTPVPESVPEVLPMLQSGAINIMFSPPLSAEQMQWASQLDHMNSEVITALIGASLITNSKLDSLTADQRAMMEETSKIMNKAFLGRIRKEDNAAYDRLKGKMETAKPNEAQTKEWEKIYREAIHRLTQGVFSKDMVDRIVRFSGRDPNDLSSVAGK